MYTIRQRSLPITPIYFKTAIINVTVVELNGKATDLNEERNRKGGGGGNGKRQSTAREVAEDKGCRVSKLMKSDPPTDQLRNHDAPCIHRWINSATVTCPTSAVGSAL